MFGHGQHTTSECLQKQMSECLRKQILVRSARAVRRDLFLNAQINDGCPICLKGIAHLYVTLGCDYREHLTPTQRRARQDGPPQRNLPATFHNAIFRTAYLSSS